MAKHDAQLSAAGDEGAVRIVEAMVSHRTQQGGAVPAIYDVVSARLKTVPVLVKILDAAVKRCADGRNAVAACRDAAFELLEAIDLRVEVIAAAGDQWRTRLESSMGAIGRATRVANPALVRSILAYLGKLATVDVIAERSAVAFVGRADALEDSRPSVAKDPTVRFVATWVLARMLRHASGPRRALAIDVLAGPHADSRQLGLLEALERRGGAADMAQRILGVQTK